MRVPSASWHSDFDDNWAETNDLLRQDALAKGPLLIQACREAHEHSAVACYEKRYGIILRGQPKNVNVIRESDRPLYTSPDFSADPLDVVLAREELDEAIAALDDAEDVA